MFKRMTWPLVLLALSASCQKFAEGRQMFRDMLVLRDQIAAQFHEQNVGINASTGGRITVTFTNSPLNSATGAEKQKRADEVAAFVISHYKQPVTTVSTAFVTAKGGLGVSVSTSDTYIGHPAQKP